MAYHVKRVGSFRWEIECGNIFEYLTVKMLLVTFSIIVAIAGVAAIKALV